MMFSSRNQPDIRPDGPDPLGSEYSSADRDLDMVIGESLRQLPVPEGLASRVAQASLESHRQQARMRLAPAKSAVAIKRLALAACVGLAFLGALWWSGPGLSPTTSTTYASLDQPLVNSDMYLSYVDDSGLLASHDLKWTAAHDELLNILEAEQDSDSWGYLALEIR
ncbi:MAG: hypothetical protein CMJ40_07505 [Phycisphaerae bacterium]|nr:hypothetical protein [Phycisphaerae bacterium]|tara:strand:- start:335 stop:835 length:501 start_codon:yes stop_codon:yes gene_type:complete